MTRIEELYNSRKRLFDEVFKPSDDKGEDVSIAVKNMYLQEISDTLALMYDKMCEDEDLLRYIIKRGTPLPDNATNGEIIKALFPDIEIADSKALDKIYTGIPFGDLIGANVDCMRDWWNAEYKEPTKSCSTCRNYKGHAGHCEICHNMSMYKKVEPTTKNCMRSTRENEDGNAD